MEKFLVSALKPFLYDGEIKTTYSTPFEINKTELLFFEPLKMVKKEVNQESNEEEKNTQEEVNQEHLVNDEANSLAEEWRKNKRRAKNVTDTTE